MEEMTQKNLEAEEGSSEPAAITFKSKQAPQYLAAIIAAMGAFCLGMALGWSNTSLPDIEERGDLGHLKADSEIGTWIGAILPLGCIISGIIGGIFVDRIGRKWTMLLLAPPFVVGWVIICMASSPMMVLAGRFITGLCGGSFCLTVPVYASEIAENKIRGVVSNMFSLILAGGILFTYTVGSLVSWQTMSIISAIVPVLFAIGMLFMPETPAYLLSKGKDQQARKALKWLRGADSEEDIEPELKMIRAGVEDAQSQSASLKDLFACSVLKPLGVSLMLMILQQLSGINVIIFYSVDIFRDAGAGLNANVSTIIVGAVQVVFVFVGTILIDRLGRKILLIVSEIGMSVSLLALGVYFYMKEHHPDEASSLGWLPLTSLVLYVITYNIAMGPIPWTMMGELLPPHVKGITSSFATAFCWTLGFLITKFFGSMLSALHAYGCYWVFSACSFAGLFYCLFIVPETKGKSLEEIQAHFGKK